MLGCFWPTQIAIATSSVLTLLRAAEAGLQHNDQQFEPMTISSEDEGGEQLTVKVRLAILRSRLGTCAFKVEAGGVITEMVIFQVAHSNVSFTERQCFQVE